MRPLNNYVLVKAAATENVTSGGLIITGTTKRLYEGKCIDVGDTVSKITTGDYVYFIEALSVQKAGTPDEFYVVAEEKIYAVK